jgi:cell cycle checkpoint protein
MFYPTSLKLWRIKEEIESTIDLWVTRLMKGDDDQLSAITAGAATFSRPKVGIVESWKNARSSNRPNQKSTKEDDTLSVMALGISARKEMLLERLPYMVAIAQVRKGSSSALAISDMEKVTSFQGIGGPSEETDDGDDTAIIGEEWATDKPIESTSLKKKALVIRGRAITLGLSLQRPEQKLVLSDDDIDDD